MVILRHHCTPQGAALLTVGSLLHRKIKMKPFSPAFSTTPGILTSLVVNCKYTAKYRVVVFSDAMY